MKIQLPGPRPLSLIGLRVTSIRSCFVVASLIGFQLANIALPGRADGPADNIATQVRPIPPTGIEVPDAVKRELMERAAACREKLNRIQTDSISQALIEVFPRAVELACEQDMFYSDKEFEHAKELLAVAEQRLDMLMQGKFKSQLFHLKADPDSDSPQLAIGGYRSRIDESVQPFGLVLPAKWDPKQPLRLDVWLHGRGEKSSEVAFLYQRSKQIGEFSPPNTIVLHPYGRYCNAFKFAGEIDVLEAMECVQQLFSIDPSRMAIRGFSMGGAGCWQMAVHYPGIFAAANPGAGFSETTEFLRVFQQENFQPTDYQKRLLHWYDCPDWTNNLRNVPTVAYSGEVDNQRQAAEIMATAFRLRGMELPHVIGPQTGHKILAESKPIIQSKLDAYLNSGKARFPKTIDLTTYHLRYHELAWLSIEGLDRHWDEATVHAELGGQQISIQTRNVSRVRLSFEGQELPINTTQPVQIEIDSQRLLVAPDSTPGGGGQPRWSRWLGKDPRGLWELQQEWPASGEMVKRPGLSGPIDDAFMESFIWVPAEDFGKDAPWYSTEFQHATGEWRRHFRGDLRIKRADQLTAQDIANCHLILFGTPQSHSLISKVADRLPIQWNATSWRFRDAEYPAATHAPVLIYPNPLNPSRYIVLNSGFTFREFAYLNNARQIPMLGDWAIVDFSKGATMQYPGQVIAGGFFDERWR